MDHPYIRSNLQFLSKSGELRFISLALVIALSGCLQPPEPPVITCEEYCPLQPHVKCLGQWQISGAYPDCICDFKCGEEPKLCAEEGEQFSVVYTDEYPPECCEGLTEWHSGMDASISIAGKCYETGMLSGLPVGTCIDCGDSICDELESVCNCPVDCEGKGQSDFKTVAEFCASPLWLNVESLCDQQGMDMVGGMPAPPAYFPICELCVE